MTTADPSARTASAQTTVERSVAELRRGGAVALSSGGRSVLAIAAELLEEPGLAWLAAAAAPAGPRLLLTAERAAKLGLGAHQKTAAFRLCALPEALSADAVRQLADPTVRVENPIDLGLVPAQPGAEELPAELGQAAIDLAKAARLLPAMAMAIVPAAALDQWVAEPYRLAAADVTAYRRSAAATLKRVGSAQVPLTGAEETEIIAFRPSDGGKEHLAIVIGKPDLTKPVLTRLHSECFTGDLLGSLRCDCGDQLRGAIEEIAKSGSGILLYLAQEGRGIGLINKLRAYRLQDAGADTADANLQLGFGADERVYHPAAEMLRQLGVGAVRLLTNNPDKVKGLAQCGIAVSERVPHIFPANDHNERYLSAKALKFGHMF